MLLDFAGLYEWYQGPRENTLGAIELSHGRVTRLEVELRKLEVLLLIPTEPERCMGPDLHSLPEPVGESNVLDLYPRACAGSLAYREYVALL